jgi:hypothetical protein
LGDGGLGRSGWTRREEVSEMVAAGYLRVRAHAFAWALCAALIFMACVAEVARAGQITAGPSRVQVWNINTKGMSIGAPDPTDYRNFVAYIIDPARVPYIPDIITLQEAGYAAKDRASCHEFAGLIAYVSHVPYDCRESQQQGGAGVVFRTDRFALDTYTDGNVTEQIRPAGGACNDSPTWRAFAVRLRETNGKHVSVASFHFPKADNLDADCAWENMKKLNSKLASLPTDMQIAAGDANHADAITAANSNHAGYSDWEYWYRHSNLRISSCTSPDLCFKDVMYQKWANAFPTAGASSLFGYMHQNEWSWSHSGYTDTPADSERWDYIWAKPQAVAVAFDAASQPRTAPWGVAAGMVPYSDHRGQGALLAYP